MVNRTLSIWNELRPFQVGFDHAFERFNTQLEHTQGSNFPPYNIKKLNDFNWTIEMALAGFNKKDIEVLYSDNQLTIKSIFEKDEAAENLWAAAHLGALPTKLNLFWSLRSFILYTKPSTSYSNSYLLFYL